MALTVSRTGDWQHLAGNRRVANVTLTFDSSYPTGGESFVASDVGMRTIEKVLIQPDNGYSFEYDYTNSLLLVYIDQSNGVLSVQTTATQSSGVVNEDVSLMTYTIPASTVLTNGQGIRVTSWGFAGGLGNTNTVLRAWYGTAQGPIFNMQIAKATTWNWRTVYEVVRTGSATANVAATTIAGANATSPIADIEVITGTSVDHTIAQIVRMTSNAASPSSVTQNGMIVEMIGTPGTGGVGIEVQPGADLSSLNNVRATVWGY